MNERPEQPSVMYLPPSVINNYVGQWITTSIPTFGQVIAFVTDFNRRTGMVSMFIYQAPYYRPQFIQVHNSDLIGIAPYYGPVPPRPQPNPWHPGGGGGGHHGGGGWHGGGHGGNQGGGGFWPWMWNQTGSMIFRNDQQPPSY